VAESYNARSYWKRIYIKKRKLKLRRRKKKHFGFKSGKWIVYVLVDIVKINILTMINLASQKCHLSDICEDIPISD
jgi:hypothetical protein